MAKFYEPPTIIIFHHAALREAGDSLAVYTGNIPLAMKNGLREYSKGWRYDLEICHALHTEQRIRKPPNP